VSSRPPPDSAGGGRRRTPGAGDVTSETHGIAGRVRALAIEGGGVRGIIPGRLLVALETLAERRISDMFDVIVGTSAGGMMALGLTCPDDDGMPRYAADHVAEIYQSRGQEIFPPATFSIPRTLQEARELLNTPSQRVAMFGFNPEVGNARYSPAGIEQAFLEYFGDVRLSDALTDTVVAAYDFQTKSPVLFSSREARDDPNRDAYMRDVARATSAAPTYLPPARLDWAGQEDMVLVDGGIFAKNPSMIAYVEAVTRARERGLEPDDITLVFVGTGRPERTEPVVYKEFIGRSWIRLAEDLFRAAEDGQSALQDQMVGRLAGAHYWPFQTTLGGGASYLMDDVSPVNVSALTALGDKLVGERLDDLKRLATALTTD
jgi:predicted acylesterase/phospholipase RssA